MAANGKPASKSKQTDCGPAYYIEDQPHEARLRYKEKLKYDKGSRTLPDPYKLSSGWTSDMCTWPDITYGDIYSYLIESPGIFTKQSLKAYKSLDAYKYVQSGHVQEVFYHEVEKDCSLCFLKAKVIPSQRVTDRPQEPWICVGKESGEIYCAHCTCMAGLGEVCSHAAAVMFKVHIANILGLTTKSSTSDICKWNSTFRKEIEPKTITEMQHIMMSGNRSKPVKTTYATSKDELPSLEILKGLHQVCPNATFFTTIPSLIESEQVPTHTTESVSANDTMPSTLLSLHKPEFLGKTWEEINDECSETWSKYEVTPEQAKNLESVTRNQIVCERWFEHRKGRITASKAHDVYVRKQTTKPQTLVKKIMGYKSYDLSKNTAVKWGIDSEETARQQYSAGMKTMHNEHRVDSSGLKIDTSNPFLGASTDGVRVCKCCGKGTLEIKCPYKHRQNTIEKAASTDSSFCLDKDLKLKKNHKYYTQVQLQMHIHQVMFCDFVVYTECDMIVNVVPYDAVFCEAVVKKCEAFFKAHVLPEIFTRQLHEHVSNDINQSEHVEIYCLCREPAYGKMVQCTNMSDCPSEWFHYDCVNIKKRKPRGKWLCPSCKQ